jgi:hypothetical protein
MSSLFIDIAFDLLRFFVRADISHGTRARKKNDKPFQHFTVDGSSEMAIVQTNQKLSFCSWARVGNMLATMKSRCPSS